MAFGISHGFCDSTSCRNGKSGTCYVVAATMPDADGNSSTSPCSGIETDAAQRAAHGMIPAYET